MNAAKITAILPEVKNYLNITWQDDDTDQRIADMIAGAAAYLDLKLGQPGDYLTPGLPRTLLFERVRYQRDGALDVFENNYLSLILAAQHERLVEQYAQDTIQTDE